MTMRRITCKTGFKLLLAGGLVVLLLMVSAQLLHPTHTKTHSSVVVKHDVEYLRRNKLSEDSNSLFDEKNIDSYLYEVNKAERMLHKEHEPQEKPFFYVNKTGKYKPTWESLDARPLPAWYDDAKFGIFLHWGVYSVPSIVSEWFWDYWKGQEPHQEIVYFMEKNYPPSFTYPDFGVQFTAELFNATEWARIFKASGAKYVVLTSKHHEGFTNWPSSYSFNWNSNDIGPHRDLVGEMASAIRTETDMLFGLYYSLFEWFHPLYIKDSANYFSTNEYVQQVSWPQLHEIVNKYLPAIVWADGCRGPTDYWRSKEFLAWLYNDSPVKDYVVANDRWGDNMLCYHGGFYTCSDRYNPGVLKTHKWENCMTIDKKSWGYRREARLEDFLSIEELISTLASTVSCGGNLLMNVGPTHDGRIAPIFEERLRGIGSWLKINGEAIYATKPWVYQNDTITSNVWYTSKSSQSSTTIVYAILLKWPLKSSVVLGAIKPTTRTQVSMLGYSEKIVWKQVDTSGINVTFPGLSWQNLPSKYAWVIKFEDLEH